jgi:MFS transporter, ACDE family, multidrug resistance protein
MSIHSFANVTAIVQPNRSFKLATLLAAGSLTTMAGAVVAPVLPDMVQQLQLDPALAGNLVSFHCLTIGLFSAPLGILADRIGRLRVLIPSLILYALFGVAGAFASDITTLLVLRGLLGAATGGIAAASLGILTSMYQGAARTQALALATSTLTITGIFFPLMGGLVGATHWQFAFGLYSVSLPLAVLVAVALKKIANPPRPPKSDRANPFSQIIRNTEFLRLLLLMTLCSVAMYSVVIYAPLYLKQAIGASSVLNGILLASRAVGAAIISATATKWLIQRFGSPRAIAVGFTLMAATLATIPVLTQFNWILLAAIGFGMGFGIALPSLYSSLADFAPDHLRSSILSAGTGAGFLGQFLCPILLGPVLHWGGLVSVFYTTASIVIAAGAISLTARKRRLTVDS